MHLHKIYICSWNKRVVVLHTHMPLSSVCSYALLVYIDTLHVKYQKLKERRREKKKNTTPEI